MKYNKQNLLNFRKKQFRIVFFCVWVIIIPLFMLNRNQDDTTAFIPDGIHAAPSIMTISKQSDILDEVTRDVEVGETEQEFRLIHKATFDTLDYAFGVYVKNGLAYIADQHQDLLIVDVSDPHNPIFISQGHFDSSTRYGIEVKDNYCYVAGWNNKLPIFDISNIHSPVLVHSLYSVPSDAHDFVIQNDLIYIADYIHGMYIYNISTPTSPTFVGSYSISYQLQDIEVVNDYAYLATMDGLLILNVSDVTNPSYVTLYSTAERIDGLIIKDNYAYVAGGTQGLLIFNITNPLAPTIISSYNTPGFAVRVQLRLNHAFVCDLEGGLQIINVTDIMNPTITYELTSYTNARSIFFDGNYVYLANGNFGLEIFYILSYTKTSKISITGDVGLDAFSNKTGSGTEEDPYVISNYEIDAEGLNSCIEISGIRDRWLELNYLKVSNSGNSSVNGDSGIKIFNSSKISITNCIFDNCSRGINLVNCTFTSPANLINNIIGTTQTDTSIGIELDYCRNVKIRNCNVFNYSKGLVLVHSEQCEITNITIAKSSMTGINLIIANNETIKNNDITITNNLITENYCGVYGIGGGINSVISNNLFSDNQVAVRLWAMNHVSVENNIFILKEKQVGSLGALDVIESSYIYVKNNSITSIGSSKSDFDIKLSYSDNNDVSSNIMDRSYIGIGVDGGYNNKISENILTNCEQCIRLVSSSSNTVRGNQIDGYALDTHIGIYLCDSDYNEVSENTITRCNVGISLEGSDYNTISNNFISYCETGIYLLTSNDNQILSNEFDGNSLDYYEENSSGNVFEPYLNTTKLILWITLPTIFIASILLGSVFLPKLYKKRAPIRESRRLEQEKLLQKQHSTMKSQIEKSLCTKCGNLMPGLGLNFCVYCGHEFEKSEAKGGEDIPQMKMICPYCGKKGLDPNLRTCLFCGKKI